MELTAEGRELEICMLTYSIKHGFMEHSIPPVSFALGGFRFNQSISSILIEEEFWNFSE